ncbi:MAG: hypothetical protein M0C28_07515 [Candidatus Moduliflexus flocculans]|nr:hypothetical protein [Candidatus Moduliflexus flocculans]
MIQIMPQIPIITISLELVDEVNRKEIVLAEYGNYYKAQQALKKVADLTGLEYHDFLKTTPKEKEIKENNSCKHLLIRNLPAFHGFPENFESSLIFCSLQVTLTNFYGNATHSKIMTSKQIKL